jgi:hypothetical protein
MNTLPMFASSPRVKLYIGAKTIGLAIGFNFNLSVDVQTVYCIGQYQGYSLEPTYYNPVTGTIQMQRLSSNMFSNQAAMVTALNAARAIDKLNPAVVPPPPHFNNTKIDGSNDLLVSPGALMDHLNPSTVIASMLFDMDVYIDVLSDSAAALVAKDASAVTAEQLAAQKAGTKIASVTKPVKWFTIEKCRLTSRNTNITLGQLVNEPISFSGLMLMPEGSDVQNKGFASDNGSKDN